MYPDIRARRQRTIAADGAVIVALVLFGWVAIRTNHAVAGLKHLGDGIVQAGSSVQHAFSTAAGAVAGSPIIGSQLSSGLRTAGVSTGAAAITAGHQGQSDAAKLATLVSWLIFLLPSALLLQQYIPSRVRQIHRLTAAARVLHHSPDESYRRLIAQRGMFSLTYQQLLHHTHDPL